MTRAFLAVACIVFASCTTQDQWLETAASIETGIGMNRGDMDSQAGSKNYDQDSLSFWVGWKPFVAFGPPHRVRFENQPVHVEPEPAPPPVPAVPVPVPTQTREECGTGGGPRLVADDRFAGVGDLEGSRPVPASAPLGLSAWVLAGSLIAIWTTAIVNVLTPEVRRSISGWFRRTFAAVRIPRRRKAT